MADLILSEGIENSPQHRALISHRSKVRETIENSGGSNVRVFGSVARGDESMDSDIDIIFSPGKGLSLMTLEHLETELSKILGFDVDLSPDTALRPDLRDQIIAEAIPL